MLTFRIGTVKTSNSPSELRLTPPAEVASSPQDRKRWRRGITPLPSGLLHDDGGPGRKTGKTSEWTPTLAQLFVPLLPGARMTLWTFYAFERCWKNGMKNTKKTEDGCNELCVKVFTYNLKRVVTRPSTDLQDAHCQRQLVAAGTTHPAER